MLTAICKEYGILGDLDSLETLMLFQAKKATGDYHANMDSDMFCKWLVEYLFPVLREKGIKAILIMDNASYHLVPAPGSINVKSMTKKSEVVEILKKYNIPFRDGRAPRGDTLDQLKAILTDWLKENAAVHGLVVGLTRVQQLCKEWGHMKPIMTPPYHPELQPIEKLWRDVKMYVAREFAGTRNMEDLKRHTKEGFRKYGTVEATAGKIEDALGWEKKYREEGVYAEVIDLTMLDDDTDDEVIIVDDVSDDDDGYYDDDL
jgi:transposase